MTVGEAMSPARITVGTSHTLREAARRMTRGQVGSAVVLDPALPGRNHHRARRAALHR